MEIQQGVRQNVMVFMTDSETGLGKTDLTLSVKISKDGSLFQSSSLGTAQYEVGYGWYKVTLTETDTDTVGFLAVHVEAVDANSFDGSLMVIYNPDYAIVSVDKTVKKVLNVSTFSQIDRLKVWRNFIN